MTFAFETGLHATVSGSNMRPLYLWNLAEAVFRSEPRDSGGASVAENFNPVCLESSFNDTNSRILDS